MLKRWCGEVVASAATLVALTAGSSAQYRAPIVACSLADYNIALDLVLPLKTDGSRSPAAAGMQGDLQIHHQKVPRERRSWPLDKRQPTHFWLAGNDLKIRLMLATGEELVDLVIETQRRIPDDSDYAGSFRLETAEGVRVTGRIACTAG